MEIGGSFRIPDVMAKSGAILREVGTTNRTRIADYEHAITERTRLLLRVHRSNFEITGFTEQASTAELVALARKRGIPLMEDLGSGALFDLRSIGISGEPGVLDSLRSGVDIVTYSGDKLLGGPQAGLISGGSELIARMRSNSLFRALARGQADLRRAGSDASRICPARSRCDSHAAHDAAYERSNRRAGGGTGSANCSAEVEGRNRGWRIHSRRRRRAIFCSAHAVAGADLRRP